MTREQRYAEDLAERQRLAALAWRVHHAAPLPMRYVTQGAPLVVRDPAPPLLARLAARLRRLLKRGWW